jgi:hypothetical protein
MEGPTTITIKNSNRANIKSPKNANGDSKKENSNDIKT